jgi:hypothetical protein
MYLIKFTPCLNRMQLYFNKPNTKIPLSRDLVNGISTVVFSGS